MPPIGIVVGHASSHSSVAWAKPLVVAVSCGFGALLVGRLSAVQRDKCTTNCQIVVSKKIDNRLLRVDHEISPLNRRESITSEVGCQQLF